MNLSRRSAAWVAFATVLPVDLATMNRTIGFVDRGELAAAAWTFGIPHPTGYPTLMLVAGALAHLVPLRPVVTLNAFAALLVAASAGVLVLLFDRVLARCAEVAEAPGRPLLALGAALATAFTLTWWQQANGFEVYALHVLLLPLVTLLGLDWIDAVAGGESRAVRRAGFAFALVTGLSFTNHLTTALLAPGLIAAAALRLGPRRFARALPALVPPFLLGLLPLAWLPIRSAMHPALDWSHARTPAGFLTHVTGGGYHGFLFPSLADFGTQLRYVAARLPADFAWAGIALAALGAVLLARRDRPLAALAVAFTLAGIVFAAGYRVMDVDAYLLAAVLGLALLLVAGLARVAGRFGARAALGTAALLVAVQAGLHWQACDESGNRMVEEMTLDQIAPLPPRAVFVSALWDFGQSASLYFQQVEGLRRDVLVVNSELVKRSWYVEDLARRAPDLLARIPRETAALLAVLRAAEAGRPVVRAEADAAYRGFLAAFVAAATRDRAVFVSGPFTWLPRDRRAVPWGVAFRVWPEPGPYLPDREAPLRLRLWKGREDSYLAMTAWMYGHARLERARYEAAAGRADVARRVRASATAFDPHFRIERVGTQPLAAQDLVFECARFYAGLESGPAVATDAAR